MAESYKKAKLITTTGATSGFVGFQNVHTAAQNITISGPFIYGSTGLNVPIGISAAVGQIVPLNCTSITPALGNVLGFLA